MTKEEIYEFLDQLESKEYFDEENEMSVWDSPWGTGQKGSPTCCTVGAMIIAHKFNGSVYGYLIDHYNDDIIGASCGGHDFAIVDRFLVDYWAGYVNSSEKELSVYDLTNGKDIANAMKRYLPIQKWDRLELWKF